MLMKSEDKKRTAAVVVALIIFCAVVLIGAFLAADPDRRRESVNELMNNAVLHETDGIDLFGIMTVNPSVVSAYIVTAMLLLIAALIRIFAVPRFTYVPGAFQSIVEKCVEFFDDTAKKNSPHHNSFLSAYIFSAGLYIFFGTIFELFGIQAVNANGISVSLPAPLSDINAALSLGCLSYLVILGGGIVHSGLKGAGSVLKDFSLPVSMSFRMFGALLSGLLVTELVYYTISLSIVLPVAVGLMFTVLHALVQTYVLITLTSVFYGEAAEPRKNKKTKGRRSIKSAPADQGGTL